MSWFKNQYMVYEIHTLRSVSSMAMKFVLLCLVSLLKLR